MTLSGALPEEFIRAKIAMSECLGHGWRLKTVYGWTLNAEICQKPDLKLLFNVVVVVVVVVANGLLAAQSISL